MLGRPINPGRHLVEEIHDAQLVEDDDVSGFAQRPEPAWYVQMAPGDVRAVTAEQLRDFYRLGVIDRDTYLWQPGAQQWQKLSVFVGNEEPAAEEDEWQVRMGPGDVRRVSLEQLDDFYRLGVIDGQTLVWQAGMSSWAKLAELIGEEPEDAAEDVWYALMPTGEAKQLTLEQLDDFYRVDVITERTPIWKEGMKQWLPLGTVAGITAPTTVQPVAMQAPAKPVSVGGPLVWPPASAADVVANRTVPNQGHPSANVPRPAPVPSAPPLAVTVAPMAPRTSASGRWLVRACLAAGVLLGLLRNDVLFSAAQAYRQQEKFVQLEQEILGGPSFGTPRAVEALVAASGGELAPVRLPWIVQERREGALRQTALAAKAPTASPALGNGSATGADASTASSKQPTEPAPKLEPKASAAESATKPPATLSSLGPSKKAATPKSTARPARKPGTKGKSVFGAKGDRYDPLNAAL